MTGLIRKTDMWGGKKCLNEMSFERQMIGLKYLFFSSNSGLAVRAFFGKLKREIKAFMTWNENDFGRTSLDTS